MKTRSTIPKKQSRAIRQTGSSLVELAITIPLLMTVLLGAVQWSLVWSARLTLSHAASVGARYASTGPEDSKPAPGAVSIVTRNSIVGLVDPTDVTVTVTNYTLSTANDSRRIVVDYDLDLIFPYVVPGSTNGELPIQVEAIAR